MSGSVEERVAILEAHHKEALSYRQLREKKDKEVTMQLLEIQNQVTLTKGAIGMFLFLASCIVTGINLFWDNISG